MANRVTVILDVVADKATASFRNFRTAIQDADGTVNKFKTGANAAFDSVKQNAGNLAMAAGAALITFGVKAVGAFQDLALAAGKFSEATGIAVEDASRLIEVAGDIGIEAGTLQGAIQRMNKSLADGKAPTDDLTAAIKRGADGNIDSKETFIELATQIGKIKDPTLRAKAAQETFGRSYGEIAELMSMDAHDLRKALDEVSDAKVIDEEELRKARELREAFDKLRDAGEDVALLVGGTLAPVVTDLADAVSATNDVVSKLTGQKGGGGLGALIDAGWRTVPGLGAVIDKFKSVTDDGEDAEEATNELSGSFVRAAAEGRAAAREMEDLAEEEADLEEQTDRTTESFERLKAELGIEEQVDALAQGFDDVAASAAENYAAVAEGTKTAEQATRDYNATVRSLKERVIEFGESVGNLPPATVVKINALIDQGAFAEAERMIALLTRRREFPISPRYVPGGSTPKFATGTSSAPAGVALVGEQGPELVQLAGGERVMSAGATQAALRSTAAASGAGLVINMYGTSATPEQVVSAIRQYERRNGTSWRS
jgi:hypothetical protein